MTEENTQPKQRTSSTKNDRDQTLYNVVDREDRKQESPTDEDEMNEFLSWSKKYNYISKEIRKNALEQEKKELEKLQKSPIVKYFEGSREDRLLAIEEEKKLLEEMEILSKSKEGKKGHLSVSEASSVENTTMNADDQEFEELRKKYYDVSKEIRKSAVEEKEQELKKKYSSSSSRHADSSREVRLKNLEVQQNSLRNIETLQKARK